MVKSRADTHNKVMAVLTPEQRKQAREYGPWWATEEGSEPAGPKGTARTAR